MDDNEIVDGLEDLIESLIGMRDSVLNGYYDDPNVDDTVFEDLCQVETDIGKLILQVL